jgi:hypothetical protein
LTVIFGLFVQERAKAFVAAPSPMVRNAGRRSARFGSLIAAAATPWVIIGIVFSQIL